MEAATWKAETRPRQKYAKLSYAGWRTELASLLDWTSDQRCAWPEETRQSAKPQVRQAPLAQSAERRHGKEKVYGSIP